MEEKIKELEKRIEQLERENVMSKEALHLITNNISKLTEGMDKVSIIVKAIVDKMF
jgi:predicted ribosome quality control (RQC) complex YloA/Tae2 family protein